MTAGRFDWDRRSEGGQEVTLSDPNEGLCVGGSVGLLEVWMSCSCRMGPPGDSGCLKWWVPEQSWDGLVLPIFLSLEFQSIFLKEPALQFPVYELENLCLCMLFFPHYSETSGNSFPNGWSAALKLWLRLPNDLGGHLNLLFCSPQTLRC